MVNDYDRLPDWAFTEEELIQEAVSIITIDKFCDKPTYLCWYDMLHNYMPTGISMLLAVESIVGGQQAINRICSQYNITAAIGVYSDTASVYNNMLIEQIHTVLHKYKYNSTQKFVGSDKLFLYQPWMAKLI